MQIFEELTIKFEKPEWKRDTELALFDTILEKHPHLIMLLSEDITSGCIKSDFGRKDTPSVEQIVRAAIYKEIKGLEYRELAYDQIDSRICAQFVKIDEKRPYSFQVYQKYISKVSSDKLKELLYELNKIAISEGLEDINRIRMDTTVIESNIHYPTNNSLVWDCIHKSYDLLSELKEELKRFTYIDYSVQAKKTYFKINNTKEPDKRIALFHKQLILFTKTIN